MASRKGPVATDTPHVAPIAPPSASHLDAGTTEDFATDTPRAMSLKRSHEAMATSPDEVSADDMSPSKIARLVGYARQSPPSPTAPDALEDERARDEEGQRLHLASTGKAGNLPISTELISEALAMTRSRDASPTTSKPVVDTASKALQPVTIPQSAISSAEMKDASPHSAMSAASLDSGVAQVVDSPTEMDVDVRNDRSYAPQPEAQMEDRLTATSLSYPGLPLADASIAAAATPQRGMSLPMAPSQHPDSTPRSPSSKKHKCPYCNTEFTRHHNLKSHLLTHSQEKPFVCQDCQMRFRRLHDLKRHQKLHTGEKPHVCPICERKFARGDALARHSKGAGGCAGRRASMGSFAGDDSYEGASSEAATSAMTGIMYDSGPGVDAAEEERRRSLPSIKADHIASQPATEGYGPHARTYPPAGQRSAPSGGLFPPNVDRGTSSTNTSPSMPNSATSGHTPNTSISSMPMSAGSSSLYSQNGMTESPKPLSPGSAQPTQVGHDKQPRSPGLGAQYQAQQQFGRRQSDHNLSSGLPQPPHGMSDAAQLAWLSQYPPADATKHEGASQANASGTSAPASQQPAALARASGGVAAGTSSSNTGVVDNSSNLFASGEAGLWAYVQTMEEKVRQLTDEIAAMKRTETQLLEKVATLERNETALTSEIMALRQQLAARQDSRQVQ